MFLVIYNPGQRGDRCHLGQGRRSGNEWGLMRISLDILERDAYFTFLIHFELDPASVLTSKGECV